MSKTKLIALLGGLGCVLAAAVICLVVLLTGDAGKVQPAGSSDVTADSAPEAPAPESPGSEEAKPVERPLTGDPVTYIGRFKALSDGRMRCSWSNSTVVAGFEGTGIAVNLSSSAGEDYVNVSVDDGEPVVLAITNRTERYVLAEGLEPGIHHVRIAKRLEGSKSYLTFSGFDYLDGTAAPTPAPRERRIEVIGDSITAGYGNEGPDDWSGFKNVEENAGITYGALAAESLDAEATIIGWSGMGLHQDLGGGTTLLMPEIYQRTIGTASAADWDFRQNIPDAVVVNLGTNDFASSVDPKAFEASYVEFIHFIREKYPDAAILCVIGTIRYDAWNAIKSAVETVNGEGDANVYSFAFTPASTLGEPNGTDGHPSAQTHARMAEELSGEIRRICGW